MDGLSFNLVLHGALVLLTGFLGGTFFARAIKQGKGEVAWRVVHSGSRGLSRSGPWQGRAIWAFYMLGTSLTLLGCGLLVYGAAVSQLAS